MRTTLRGNPVVAAPGKLFLVGEYVVLEGGTAVVAAIDRHAAGEFMPGLDPGSPLVAEAVRVTAAALGDKAGALPGGSVWVESGAFAAGGRKLGLGSSAATAACSVGAVLEMAGLPVASHRDLVFSLAESAHRAWQGGVGSGADVAAAVYGGLLQFTRPGGGTPVVTALPDALASLELVVFSARAAASTAQQIGGVRAFAQRSPAAYASAMAALREATDRFLESMALRRPRETIAATRQVGRALAELGRAADVPIVTPAFERAAGLAAELGGAAKPSGAGGGDVGVALFPDHAAARAFAARVADTENTAEAERVDILELAIDHVGVHRRGAGTAE
jgi:phosphomevalonate kinase